jgi:hypothetical protein
MRCLKNGERMRMMMMIIIIIIIIIITYSELEAKEIKFRLGVELMTIGHEFNRMGRELK